MRGSNQAPGRSSRAHRPVPRALRCDPWWAIRGAGEPFEPIFAELMYGLEATSRNVVRKRPCALEWGPAIGIASRRPKRTAR
jgi:hypothetical protein